MLFGHLARMDETADARRILTGVHQSDWSRPVGHPCTSWMATLKSDLSLHNLTFEDAIEQALDKLLWRLLVASSAVRIFKISNSYLLFDSKLTQLFEIFEQLFNCDEPGD